MRIRTRFFAILSLLLGLTVFIGFARTYYLRVFFRRDALPAALHLHGFAMSAWIALLIVQIALVRTNRVAIHRRLGILGGVLAAAMIVLTSGAALFAARRDLAARGGTGPLRFLAIPFVDLLMFAAFVALALWYRKRPETHKRLMLLATIVIIPAALARFPFSPAGNPWFFFGVSDLFAIAILLFDWLARRRMHPAMLYGTLALIVTQPLRFLIGGTAMWIAFARRLV